MIEGQLLFPSHILHAMNALQHLYVLLVLGKTSNSAIYSTCEDIAKEIEQMDLRAKEEGSDADGVADEAWNPEAL